MGTGSSVEHKAAVLRKVLYAREELLALRDLVPHAPIKHDGPLFCDPGFPLVLPQDKTRNLDPGVTIKWLRPLEIMPTATLFAAAGPSACEVWQGELGDCYLLGALSALAAGAPDAVRSLFISPKHTLAPDGCCKIQLFANSEWHVVIIDDRLPCLVTSNGIARPMFCKPTSLEDQKRLLQSGGSTPVPFWAALLEKAYAKLFGHGEYSSIVPGNLSDALIDLSGGFTMRMHPHAAANGMSSFAAVPTTKPKKGNKQTKPSLAERQAAFFDRACRAHEEGDVLCAYVGLTPEGRKAAKKANLLTDHAYAVLRLAQLPSTETAASGDVTQPLRMIQLRNPWGQFEWSGAFSDGSAEWTPELRSTLGHTDAEDGAFWMCLRDFWSHFEDLASKTIQHDCFGVTD